MSFFDWLDTKQTFNRRIDRGYRAFRCVFNRYTAENISEFLLFCVMLVVTIPTYLLGWICEWRDNRRDGVKTVRRG